ncbi:MAG: D-aminoacylase [Gemmataceae bacterium]|nr:D-aminoacylase [Gemmataceae bacterium]
MYSLLLTALCVAADPQPATIVIRGATIIDGTGRPGYVGDVALRGDRIIAVGKFSAEGPVTEVRGEGLVVAPGFIDLHTHSDFPLQAAATRANLSYTRQGVTTVVTGNCGSGPVDVAAFYAKLEKGGIGGNVAHLVPHNDVRNKVMGNVNRAPDADELAEMVDLVETGMAEGAWGLATGLIYNPGTYSKTEEIIALARPAAKHGGIYASHMRDEGTGLLDAIGELIRIGKEAGLPAHVSHIKCSGKRAWGQASAAVTLIEKARAQGQVVTADQYPYTASSTSLRAMVIPARFREGSAKELKARLEDPDTGPKLRAAIEQAVGGRDGGSSIRIATYKPKKEWQGKSLAEIAKMEGKSATDIAIEIEKNGGAQAVSFGMNEEDLRLFLRQSWVATASDGSSKMPDDTVPHPRSYGTFPRKIGLYAVKENVIPLEQAVRSSSGLPADILSLPERGYLRPGYFADVVVFDPKTIIDTATFDKPHQFAQGVKYLYVNGTAVIDDGADTKKLPGRALRHTIAKNPEGPSK